MNLPIVLRDEAQAEFDEAFDFNERQWRGSGVKFVARVQDVFDQIGANPQLHAAVFTDIRKAVVARSPYCVFYRAEYRSQQSRNLGNPYKMAAKLCQFRSIIAGSGTEATRVQVIAIFPPRATHPSGEAAPNLSMASPCQGKDSPRSVLRFGH